MLRKPVSIIVVAIVAVAAIAGIIVYFSLTAITNGSGKNGMVISADNFTVYMIEDNDKRLLAKLENNGPPLNDTGAFLVRQGFNNDCEPQGIVVSNFNVGTKAGKPYPLPDYIPGYSNVTLDSMSARIDAVPTGDNLRTAVYVLKLEPDSIIASDAIEQIIIHDRGLTQLFNDCLQQLEKGYPALLKLTNPQPGSKTYFTLEDKAAGIKYETVLDVNANAPKLGEVYWPPSRDGWLSENFTKQSGPAPEWRTEEPPQQLVLTVVTTDSGGEIHQSSYPIQLARTQASIDFTEQARGKIVPPYPEFWEIVVK